MNFRFKAYNNLKKKLGEIDAIVECLEISTKEFIENITTNGIEKENIQKNIEILSTKHNIRVNYINPATFENRVMLLHIVNVYEQLECYYEDIIEEHPLIKNKSTKKKGDTLIDFILNSITKEKIKDSIEYKTLEYYRLIRNNFSHVIENEKKLTALKDDILELKNVSAYSTLNAPNDFKILTFDDFIFFTRCVKKFAQKINELYEINNIELKETILNKHKHKLKKYLDSEKRLNKLIKKLLIIEYNICDKELETLIREGLA